MAPNDPLNDRLQAAGDAISVDDDFAALNSVQQNAASHRRRRRAIAGVGIVVVLIGGGLVAVRALVEGEPDSLSIAGVDEPAPATTLPPSEGAVEATAVGGPTVDDDRAPVTTLPPPTTVAATSSPVVVAMIDAAATVVQVPADLRDAQLNWVVPWKDGFLASRTLIVPQALPAELPEEIAALFPQEVIDFFNGELPPTIAEATEMLSEAGLLDEVTAVLSEHPEASEAIYSQPTVTPSVSVEFSSNGITWEPIDFAMPPGSPFMRTVQSNGDRLVALVESFPDEPIEQEFFFPTTTVMVTDDLQTWQPIALPVEAPPPGLPDYVRYGTFPEALVVSDAGWLATTYRQYDVDVPAVLPLLPEATRLRVEPRLDQLSTSIGPEGITFYFFDESRPEGQPEDLLVSWTDLGVEPSGTETFEANQVTVASTWDGEPLVADRTEGANVVCSSDGFYSSSGSVQFAADGLDWVDLASPDDALLIESFLPVDGGVVAFGFDQDGERVVYRVEGATDTWTEIGAPELPTSIYGGYLGSPGSAPAIVVDMASNNVPESTITAEADGFTMTLMQAYPLSSVRLVDSDGAVVIDDRSAGIFGPGPGDGTFSRSDQDGLTFIDVETGLDIVTFPNATLQAAWQEAPEEDYEEHVADLWILALVDGDRWLFQDLGVDGIDAYFGSSPIAVNGSTLLFAAGPEWLVFDLS